jgi:chromosome segregation ATPase
MTQLLWIMCIVLGLIGAVCYFIAPWLKYHATRIKPLEDALESTLNELQIEKDHRELALKEAAQFRRHFQAEIKIHQAAKTAGYLKLDPLKDEKSELHLKMESVQKSLQSWHRNSKSFWGNKNLKIKEDSVLGWFGLEQTVAQKDSLERRRASLSSRIGELKEEMDEIFQSKIRPAKEEIDTLFRQKAKVAEDRKHGRNEVFYKSVAASHKEKVACLERQASSIRSNIATAEEGFKHWKKAKRT